MPMKGVFIEIEETYGSPERELYGSSSQESERYGSSQESERYECHEREKEYGSCSGKDVCCQINELDLNESKLVLMRRDKDITHELDCLRENLKRMEKWKQYNLNELRIVNERLNILKK